MKDLQKTHQRRLQEVLRRLEEAGPLLLDVRRMSYYTGTVLLLAAERRKTACTPLWRSGQTPWGSAGPTSTKRAWPGPFWRETPALWQSCCPARHREAPFQKSAAG